MFWAVIINFCSILLILLPSIAKLFRQKKIQRAKLQRFPANFIRFFSWPSCYFSKMFKYWALQLTMAAKFINIDPATKQNNTFRTALWTGDHLQLTLMSINVGENIGLENHPKLDQFCGLSKAKEL